MLIKKRRCHCHQCRHTCLIERNGKKVRFTRGTNGYKDSMHKLWVRRLRRARLDKDGELNFSYAVGYTD